MKHTYGSGVDSIPSVLTEGRYQLLSPWPVASGSYSVVYHATDKDSGKEVAIKQVRLGVSEPGYDTEKEIDTLARVQGHPGVVRLVDTFWDDSFCYIATEWCAKSHLHQYIARNGPLSEELARRIFSQLVLTVAHCHKRGVINQDLKNENILLTSEMDVRLADFGLCIVTSGSDVANEKCKCASGSPVFAAPEVYGASLSHIPFRPALAETWALGVILHSMLTGSLPFSVKYYHRTWMRYLPPTRLSACCKGLLVSMMRHTPSARISLEEVVQHSWVLRWTWACDRSSALPSADDVAVVLSKLPGIGHADAMFHNTHIGVYAPRGMTTLVSQGY